MTATHVADPCVTASCAGSVHEHHREIVPGLWHGYLADVLPPDVSVVVSCSEEALLYPAGDVEHVPFLFPAVFDKWGEVDHHEIPPRAAVLRMAGRIAGWLDEGRSVLVRCVAGQCRSALLVVVVLVVRGWSVDDAISLLREQWSDAPAFYVPPLKVGHHPMFPKSRYERWLRDELGAVTHDGRQ